MIKSTNDQWSGMIFTPSGAVFSEDMRYRYALMRRWDMKKDLIMFIGLNPSRANATFNDPTITRCINFAKAWGYGGLFFGNLFALRSPDPKIVKNNLENAIGEENCHWLHCMARESKVIVLCWGSWPFIERAKSDIQWIIDENYEKIRAFGLNKDGNPKHPLYLSSKSLIYPIIRKEVSHV